jgi:hypothetical protein
MINAFFLLMIITIIYAVMGVTVLRYHYLNNNTVMESFHN